jgi:hypothetical protein
MEEEFLRFEEDKAMGCGNLSSTLQKLYMWEKKLLEEVKVCNICLEFVGNDLIHVILLSMLSFLFLHLHVGRS